MDKGSSAPVHTDRNSSCVVTHAIASYLSTRKTASGFVPGHNHRVCGERTQSTQTTRGPHEHNSLSCDHTDTTFPVSPTRTRVTHTWPHGYKYITRAHEGTLVSYESARKPLSYTYPFFRGGEKTWTKSQKTGQWSNNWKYGQHCDKLAETDQNHPRHKLRQACRLTKRHCGTGAPTPRTEKE